MTPAARSGEGNGDQMRANAAKEKMLRGEPALGYALGLGSPGWGAADPGVLRD